MWRRNHIAVVILCFLAGSAHAQWSGAWSNYFATETMAAECYSGSVERCQAVGITPDSPSWWDYIVGKNHAKLVSVKRNIEAVCTNYLNANYATNGSFVDALASFGVDYISWSNSVHFAVSIGLPQDFFTNTPYFKTQYPSESNGWNGVRVALKNLVVTRANVDWHPNVWTNEIVLQKGPFAGLSVPHLPTLYEVMNAEIHYSLADTVPEWDGVPYYSDFFDGHSLVYLLPESTYTNARGSFTTSSDYRYWSPSYPLARDALLESFRRSASNMYAFYPAYTNAGFSWPYPMVPYEAKHRPLFMAGAACDSENTGTNITVTSTNETVALQTNVIQVCIGSNTIPGYAEYQYFETNVEPYAVYVTETNGWLHITNSVIVWATNTVSVPYTNYSEVGWATNLAVFGTHFVGSSYYATNIIYSFFVGSSNKTVISATATNMIPAPDSPVLTNIFSYYDSVTNIEEKTGYMESGTQTVPVYTNEDTIVNVTNVTYSYETNITSVSRYAVGIVVINAVPYAGTIPVDAQFGPMDGVFGPYLYGMTPLSDTFGHTVDFYYQETTPTNYPPEIRPDSTHPLPWHGYHESAPVKWNDYALTVVFSPRPSRIAGRWQRQSGHENYATVAFGNTVALYSNSPAAQLSYEHMRDIYDDFLNTGVYPPANTIKAWGSEVSADFAAIWWNGTNGFRYK